jgi:hypothetical protein
VALIGCAIAVLANVSGSFAAIPVATSAPTSTSPIIKDGGFEARLNGWSSSGTVKLSRTAHTGRLAVRIGSPTRAMAESSISQTFAVPSAGGALRLWYRPTCRGKTAHDWAVVTLADRTTGTTSTLLAKRCVYSRLWTRLSANLAAHSGHRVLLRIATRDNDREGAPAEILYDDVRMVPPDFSLSIARRALTLTPGSSTSTSISTLRTAGSTGTVFLSASGEPRGVIASLNPPAVRAGGSSTLTLTAADSASVAPATLTISAASSSEKHTAPLALTVTYAPPTVPTTTPVLPVGTRTIDRPAVDQEFPADAVVNVKTVFGARGDGVTDDTAAIQSAIAAGLGTGAPTIPHKILYFPKGTYLVSRSLVWEIGDGTWSTSLTLQGENRDQTIVKLKDHAAGFSDPANPRSVIDTGSLSPHDADGSGNEAFNNFIFDLTVDVGVGNPGAIGIDYLANNRGAIRNVVVHAPVGSGQTGISMTRPWPGPCLLQDVRVAGFEVGIAVGQPEYSVTMENIDLRNQGTAGISNDKNVVSIYDLTSVNNAPAIVNTDPAGLVTVIRATLSGGTAATAAIVNEGTVYLRGIDTSGYQAALSDQGVDSPSDFIGEYSSSGASGPFAPVAQSSLSLPIADPPSPAAGPPSSWTSIATYGASTSNPDNSSAIQAALDSGNRTIYFPPGEYEIRHTLNVPSGVEIRAFGSTLYAMHGDFATPSPASPLMRFDGATGTVTTVRSLFLYSTAGVVNIADDSAGALFLQDVQMLQTSGGYQNEAGSGPLFLEDIEGGPWSFANPQQVWARQLDPETSGLQIANDGGTLWILGLKTEQPTTAIRTSGGGSTELLGGELYPVEAVPAGTPAFAANESTVSLIYAVSAYNQYPIALEETRGGVTASLVPPPSEPRTWFVR